MQPTNGDNLIDVLFYPPNPDTLMSNNGTKFVTSTSKVYLVTPDGKASSTVSVNGAGQVSF